MVSELTSESTQALKLTEHRALGGAIDALIRSLQLKIGDERVLSERLFALWKELPTQNLEVSPLALRHQKSKLLSAEEERGAWLLPAFMAGVRGIKILPEATGEDVLRLLEELSALRSDEQSIQHIHDWFWADGAEGFEVDLQECFSEVAQDVLSKTSGAMAVRDEAFSSTLGDHQVPSRDLDVAALCDEFDVHLDAFAEQSEQTLAMAKNDVAQQSARREKNNGWVEAQLYALLRREALQKKLGAPQVARKLLSWMTHGVNAKSARLILSLKRNAFGATVFEYLEDALLGEVMAKNFEFSKGSVEAALEICTQQSPELRDAFLQELTRRASTERDGLRFLKEVSLGLPPTQLFESVCTEATDKHQVSALIDLSMGSTSFRMLDNELEKVPLQSTIDALESIDSNFLPAFSEQIVRLFAKKRLAARAAILLNQMPAPAQVAIATKVLNVLDEELSTHSYQAIAKALSQVQTGRMRLVEVVKTPKYPLGLRLAALRWLAGHDDDLRLATIFRVRELTEPSELRHRLKAVRQRLKAAS